MIWLWLVLAGLIICFGLVVLVGAPYLPTLKPQVAAALELANLKAGDTLLELGCGDGRVVLAAARRGLNVVGYELNPLLALIAWSRTWPYRRQVRIIWGNYWLADWPPADAIFVFLLAKYMPKLDKKIIQYKHKPVKLVSYAFKLPGKRPAQQKAGVLLYHYR